MRRALPVAIGAGVVAIGVLSRSTVIAAIHAFGRVHPAWLVAAAGAEVVSYLWLSLHLRLLAGHPINARKAAPIRIALVLFGLGNVLPGAPAEGLVMAGAALRRRGLNARRIAVLLGFSQWFRTRGLFAVAALDALVAVSLGDIPRSYEGGVIAGSAVTVALLVLTTWLSLQPRTAEWVARLVLRVRYWRNCPGVAERRERGATWHRITLHVTGDRRQRVMLVATTGAAWVCDGLCMYLALRAAGVQLGLDRLLLAYTVGVLASNVPLVPAGIGIVETLTPLILVHYGVPWTTAIAAVLIYRILSTLLPALGGLGALAGLRLASVDSVVPGAGVPIADAGLPPIGD